MPEPVPVVDELPADVIDLAARAAYDALALTLDPRKRQTWDELNDDYRGDFRSMAQSAIFAYLGATH